MDYVLGTLLIIAAIVWLLAREFKWVDWPKERNRIMAIHNPRGRAIPHEHHCCVCAGLIGCSDDNCHLPDWVPSCTDPECEQRAAVAIVHLQPGMGLAKLRCCGLLPGETSRGDRMTYKESEVTCPEFTEQKAANPSAKKSQAAKAQQPSA